VSDTCSCSIRSQCRYLRDMILMMWTMKKSFWRKKNVSCDGRSRRSTRRCWQHTGIIADFVCAKFCEKYAGNTIPNRVNERAHTNTIYTVSQKRTMLTYLSLCVGQIWLDFKKIGRHVSEETTNKTVQKVPTSPITCASPTLGNVKWQIELSTQYLHVHFNESTNSYKTTGSYCL